MIANNRNSGSALLVVVMIMTCLLIVASALQRSGIYAIDAVLNRERYEQQVKITEGILRHGIALCAKHREQFIKEAKLGRSVYKFDAGTWLLQEINEYQGLVDITVVGKGFVVAATLKQGAKKIMGLKCNLTPKKDKPEQLIIQNFQMVG